MNKKDWVKKEILILIIGAIIISPVYGMEDMQSDYNKLKSDIHSYYITKIKPIIGQIKPMINQFVEKPKSDSNCINATYYYIKSSSSDKPQYRKIETHSTSNNLKNLKVEMRKRGRHV